MIYPPDFTYPEAKVVAAYQAAQCIAGLAAGRRAVVQAGGCSGLWPLALAKQFDQVYTFEPEPMNFACLAANVSQVPNVAAYQVAIGETQGRVGLTRPKAQAGLWRVDGDGDVRMTTLDDALGDVVIDAIVLDVEGSEAQALRGAERLITTHRPLLWFEFLQRTEAIAAVLTAYGYGPPVHGLGGDWYSLHPSRVH